jgi:ABC-type sulfate/molybdate transport systems ATPase subunit
MNAAPLLRVEGVVIGNAPVSFEVQEGEVLAVLGENGAGKSLLLGCLSGHLRPPVGTVRVNGCAPGSQRAEVGVVFQEPGILRQMTVFENVALPFLVHGLDLDGALEEQVHLRLRLVGCGHLAHEEAHRISEGDRRCVALARALSGRTRLLIADEPVAALAPAKKALIEELLASLVQTGALAGAVVATQDVEFARRTATHILLLRAGGHRLMRREEAAKDEDCQAFAREAA